MLRLRHPSHQVQVAAPGLGRLDRSVYRNRCSLPRRGREQRFRRLSKVSGKRIALPPGPELLLRTLQARRRLGRTSASPKRWHFAERVVEDCQYSSRLGKPREDAIAARPLRPGLSKRLLESGSTERSPRSVSLHFGAQRPYQLFWEEVGRLGIQPK